MRTVYLAARYSRHDEMRGVRDVLAAYGITVTSRWIDCHTDVVGDFTSSFTPEFLVAHPEKAAPLGQHDMDDLRAADAVISFTGSGGKGGRHVEFGVGIALGKRSVVIGPRENVFHTLAQVQWYPDWPTFLRSLPPPVAAGGPYQRIGHYGESFIKDHHLLRRDAERLWGWQCLAPGCGYEVYGLLSIDAAESVGEMHAAVTVGGAP